MCSWCRAPNATESWSYLKKSIASYATAGINERSWRSARICRRPATEAGRASPGGSAYGATATQVMVVASHVMPHQPGSTSAPSPQVGTNVLEYGCKVHWVLWTSSHLGNLQSTPYWHITTCVLIIFWQQSTLEVSMSIQQVSYANPTPLFQILPDFASACFQRHHTQVGWFKTSSTVNRRNPWVPDHFMKNCAKLLLLLFFFLSFSFFLFLLSVSSRCWMTKRKEDRVSTE